VNGMAAILWHPSLGVADLMRQAQRSPGWQTPG